MKFNIGKVTERPKKAIDIIHMMQARLRDRRCPICNTRLRKMRVVAEGRSGVILMEVKHYIKRVTLAECKKCKKTFKLNFSPKTVAVAEVEAGKELIRSIENEQAAQREKMRMGIKGFKSIPDAIKKRFGIL